MKDCIGTLSKLHSIGNMLTLHVRYFYIRDGFLGPFTEALILPSIEHCYLPMLLGIRWAQCRAENNSVKVCPIFLSRKQYFLSLSIYSQLSRGLLQREYYRVKKLFLSFLPPTTLPNLTYLFLKRANPGLFLFTFVLFTIQDEYSTNWLKIIKA